MDTQTSGPPGRSRKLVYSVVASVSVIAGAGLVSIVGLYTFWRSDSGSDADRFNFAVSGDALSQLVGEQAAQGGEAVNVSGYASLYPGDRINPRYWDDPARAGPGPFGAPGIPDGFLAVSSRDPAVAEVSTTQATRIRIPAIGLDADVAELALLDLGEQRAYQTPNNVVGHIPQTAQPGQLDTGWLFGHLESFAGGEGSIFRRLPEIRDLLLEDPVDIFFETETVDYMYRVTSTSQVPQEELELTTSGNSQVTLVTCWPPRVYDQRVLVHAELIAYRPLF
jgi:LPXTG-site transpeptidase (sortase) family protein